MTITSYSLANKKRDLSDVLSTVVVSRPRLIAYFPARNPARNTKHEWLQDQIAPRSITALSVSSTTVTASATDVANVKVGTLFNIADDPAIWEVLTVATTTTFTVNRVAANGSSVTAIPNTGAVVLQLNATPVREGSENGEGDGRERTLGTDYNYTQIFRKEVVLTSTAMAVATYGNVDNNVDRQVELQLIDMAEDLNGVAIRGHRRESSVGYPGRSGGLYEFATELSVAAGTTIFDNYVINDAVQAVMGEGGMPTLCLCGIGQTRVIAQQYKNNLVIEQKDNRRGVFVGSVINEITGNTIKIVGERAMPDTEAWVIDPEGFGLSILDGRGIIDEDTTTKGFDGIRRTILGEMTLEFKNANQRCCKITGLKGSVLALAELREAELS
jgi:hypothetical protein